jgi:D-threonate/D-erythronate kinase
MRGLRTLVPLASIRLAGVDVLAISTQSRDTGLASFHTVLSAWAGLQPRFIFKKIDSTLRGNPGAEVAATLDSFGCRIAMVTPAFPAMGRVVEGGYLRLPGEIGFVPQSLAAAFPDPRCRLYDAVRDADLDSIVAEGLAETEPVVWAGSAGLASALARAVGAGCPGDLPFHPAAPIFCLGSDHPVTLEQERRLVAGRPGATVLRIRRGEDPGEILARLGGRLAPLVLSGGDTAALVCRALDVQAIHLRRELAPGIPAGILEGGPCHGLPVVTKSGGFGQPDALMQVADFFTCSPPSH